MRECAGMPSLRWIEKALRTTTETLARELASPSASSPAWSDTQWRVAQAVAAIHGISPLLATKLQWRGPQRWCEFLHDQRDQTLRRHARVTDLLERLDAAARSENLRVVALKGAALHRERLYEPGERPMSDVDLLVHPDATRALARILDSLGYAFAYETPKHVVFQPRVGAAAARVGESADNPIKVELHSRIAEQLPLARADITDRIWSDDLSAGVNFYRTPASLMTHLLLHAAGAIAFRSLRALHLEDIARLSTRLGRADWQQVLALRAEGRLWWAWPALSLVARYYPTTIPDLVLDTAQAACNWPLRLASRGRTLACVSLSMPWIHAFPGIEWSRTPAEAVAYAKSRVFPSPQLLALRRNPDVHPSLGGELSWIRQSQGRRMLRWLVSRPIRVETMGTVRAALR